MESWRVLNLGMTKYRHACTPSQVAGRPIYGRGGTEPRAVVGRRVGALLSLRMSFSRVQVGRRLSVADSAALKAGQSGVLGRRECAVRLGELTRNLRRAETRANVEFSVVFGLLSLRVFDLVQGTFAMVTGSLAASTDPGLELTVFLLLVAESLLLGAWLVKRRSVQPCAWPIVADFGLALVTVGLVPAYISRSAVWTMWPWPVPVTLSTVVLLGASFARWRFVLAGSCMLALLYVAVMVLPLRGDSLGRSTAAVNSLAYPGFAVLAFLFIRFVRRLATIADDARARVAALEREQGKARIHELLSYLRLDRFADADEELRLIMIADAQAKYEEMSSYVYGTDNLGDLEAHMRKALKLHPNLRVRTVVNVDSGVELAEEVLQQLQRALDTALSNAEQHAAGAEVVVSARSEGGQLVVTVRDDGPGFDLASTHRGFGIGEILGRQLEAVGGRGVVDSAPGRGTEVRIILPARQS
jgi:signal transduction histidine kinase